MCWKLDFNLRNGDVVILIIAKVEIPKKLCPYNNI
jgi:hypothetical protein